MIPSRPPRPQAASRSAVPARPVHPDVERREPRRSAVEASPWIGPSPSPLRSLTESLRQLNPREALRGKVFRTFAGVLAITAVAKGATFLPSYSIDDYGIVLQDSPPTSMFSQGRFGQAALLQALHLLGLEAHYARVFFVVFALVVSALLATLVVRHWGLRAGWLPVAAGSLIAVHPFTTEIFAFRTALGVIMCAFAMFALLLVPRRWSWAGVLVGAVLFALALSTYQAVLQYCLMIVLMGAAIGLTRLLVAGSASGWPPRITALLSWRRVAHDRNAALLACAVLGTGVYLLVNVILARTLHLGMVNHGLLSPDRIGERAAAVWGILKYRFVAPSPLLNQFSKRLLLLLLFTALAGLLVRTRPWLRLRPKLLLLAIIGLLAASLVWTVGVELVLEVLWPAPRVMSHVGIFWAGVLAVSYLCCGVRARRLLGVLALLIVLSFIGSSNQILYDQFRLNVRDAAKASRIIARLEALPGFSDAEAVAVNGTSWFYPLGYPTYDSDLNLSAFNAHWSKLNILREISGYNLNPAANQAQQDAAAAYCRNVQPWPGPESVAIKDGLAIICLGSQ